MLKTLFERQKKSLDHFFSSVDVSAVEKVLEKMFSCKGVLILMGVGKSGHIAQKIAATLSSTGSRSSYLCPSHALHGDLGFVTKDDIFLLFSKSGESQELLDLIPHIRRKGAFIIAAVSHENSRLAKVSDLSICLPLKEELCPFNLAPTTSTALQLLFGDSLAIALMQKRQFTMNDFAANHPSGFLGRKLTMKVADLMLKGEQLPICRPEDKLIDILHELSAKKCGCLLVCDAEGHLKGIFTDGDLRRAIESKGASSLQETLSRLMTASPLTIPSHQLVVEAMRQMEADSSRLVTVLPVLEQNRVVGLLRMHDIVQAGLAI